EALEDQTVRMVMGYAVDLANQINRFFNHTMADFEAFLQTLEEHYQVVPRGAKGKGNVTLTSFDGLLKVQFATADRITFGVELEMARELFLECVAEWAEGARPEIRTLIDDAFKTDSAGEVSREAIFRLLRLDFDDERWGRAQGAIRDAIRVVGTKRYIRFYTRAALDGPWQPVPLDIASA
ncbi:DUF3164 family protein, partial [Roseospirillum parvum]